ncbi:MAG: recombinase family protein, partial [Bacteroidota bacterium]|nr:recombinase family protein [Bacteroidota bacterium]
NEIIDYLKKHKIKAYKQLLSDLFRNPFYIGYLANKLLDGELVKGNHPSLISEDLFLKVNRERKLGFIKQNKANDNLPLKSFVRDYDTNEPFTGYIVKSKNLYYYKVNKIGVAVNRSQKMMHQKFSEKLSDFSISPLYKQPLIKQLMLTWNLLNENKVGDKISLVKKKNAVQAKIDTLDERLAFGEIDKVLYDKFYPKLYAELSEYEKEISSHGLNLSNPKELINFAVQLSMEASSVWQAGDFYEKQKLQKLIFPEGICFDAKNDEYRTIKVNPVFMLIEHLSRSLEDNKKGTETVLSDQSHSVHMKGLEPPPLRTRS